MRFLMHGNSLCRFKVEHKKIHTLLTIEALESQRRPLPLRSRIVFRLNRSEPSGGQGRNSPPDGANVSYHWTRKSPASKMTGEAHHCPRRFHRPGLDRCSCHVSPPSLPEIGISIQMRPISSFLSGWTGTLTHQWGIKEEKGPTKQRPLKTSTRGVYQYGLSNGLVNPFIPPIFRLALCRIP